MPASCNLYDMELYYRVDHPEFRPTFAYRALAYVDYGETAWSQLLFVTEWGLTYSVKVSRCLCLNSLTPSLPNEFLVNLRGGAPLPLCSGIQHSGLLNHPWPKPKGPNPDVD